VDPAPGGECCPRRRRAIRPTLRRVTRRHVRCRPCWVKAWGELRWLFSHRVQFVDGRRRRGCLQGGVPIPTGAEAGYGDLYGCPRPNARSDSLRTSFDGREGESQSLRALDRIEGIMTRMERHFAASTPAPATSSATYSAPFYPGEFQLFHFHSELLKFASVFRYFTFRDF
jgi:hypothetical protein